MKAIEEQELSQAEKFSHRAVWPGKISVIGQSSESNPPGSVGRSRQS
jgi:hypothetical protein